MKAGLSFLFLVNHLSPDLLTETLFDVSITDLDLGLRFWNDESIFHAGKCCLIVKLHFSSVDKLSAGANRYVQSTFIKSNLVN